MSAKLVPTKKYNSQKYSNPRIDDFSLGLSSALNITKHVFLKNLLHFGSGDKSDQNSYFAVDTGLGIRINSLTDLPMTFGVSLFVEGDLKERFDSRYDTVFSPSGTQDRIRSFKYGNLLTFNLKTTQGIVISAQHLQKLGGYDARATQVSRLGLGYSF